MSRVGRTSLVLIAIVAAGTGGYWAGRHGPALSAAAWQQMLTLTGGPSSPMASAAAGPGEPVIYYRAPDGSPAYSATPARTADGRDFVAVHASEEVSFDGKPAEAAPAPAVAAPRLILYYRNPMGLADTSPVPKKDSMGMDYIPVHAGEGPETGTVKVAAGRQQQTGVRTEIAAMRALVRPVRVPGSVQLDERRISVVATRSDAFITKVSDVTTGDRIARGEPLLQLYSPEIAAAGAQFLTELGNGGRGGTGGGARQRLENLGVPPEAIAELERNRKVPPAMTWRAQRDGIVLQRNATEGMKAAPGDILFRLADISTVWVLADVPEYQLGAIRPGAPATVRIRSLPGRVFEGRIALIYPEVVKETRTAKVRIELQNPEDLLLPDMYTDVDIATGDAKEAVTVSDSAVIDTGTHQTVILARGDGRFEPREVKVGAQGGGFVEIRDGVAAGDRVVTAATFLIDAESNLKAALNGMTSPEAAP
ncbi:efflux RND transporter periplasmic adaptor subunit [Labrys neptuniae]|uniref:efflux RND transporter periplasmic adaptor subunit n=1 Tax=Labrys neptuniae TaxID=376174 RepID=UPI0028917B22|nr:efflux RND transporter periplasmic adaptor subunit [Labrys neptuniae]MDT3377753.1 efflux RND transporter periplasmic adaptor subunit [Labrys neptuniae]